MFPTLTVLNLTIGPWLKDANPVLRTFVPRDGRRPDRHLRADARLHCIRVHLLARRATA